MGESTVAPTLTFDRSALPLALMMSMQSPLLIYLLKWGLFACSGWFFCQVTFSTFCFMTFWTSSTWRRVSSKAAVEEEDGGGLDILRTIWFI